jgi:RNA polymerase sigma-70 factor (ECF subfamily)
MSPKPRDPLADPRPLIRRVYGYAAYRLGDGADAEDATSDTFERALRYRSSFDPSRGSPTAWLIGIARRAVDDILAKRSTLIAEPPEVAAVEQDAALKLDLAQALRQLDPRDRELVSLRYGADLTARQIGEQLELRTNAVEVALHRALARLRTHLEAGP